VLEVAHRKRAEVWSETAPSGSAFNISIPPYRDQWCSIGYVKREEEGVELRLSMQWCDTYYPQQSAQIAISKVMGVAAAFTKDVQSNECELRHVC
jgi:hypothetical protein